MFSVPCVDGNSPKCFSLPLIFSRFEMILKWRVGANRRGVQFTTWVAWRAQNVVYPSQTWFEHYNAERDCRVHIGRVALARCASIAAPHLYSLTHKASSLCRLVQVLHSLTPSESDSFSHLWSFQTLGQIRARVLGKNTLRRLLYWGIHFKKGYLSCGNHLSHQGGPDDKQIILSAACQQSLKSTHQIYLYKRGIIFSAVIVASSHLRLFPGCRPGTLCSCCSDQLVVAFQPKLMYSSSFARVIRPTDGSWPRIDEKHPPYPDYNQQQYHDVKPLFRPRDCTLPM